MGPAEGHFEKEKFACPRKKISHLHLAQKKCS